MTATHPPGLFVKITNLEIQGFRSFRGKQLLGFTPGLNVLIGPNNAGKSNIIRAILAVKEKFDIAYDLPGRVFNTKQPDFAEEDRHLIDGKPMEIEIKYSIQFNYSWPEISEGLRGTGKAQAQAELSRAVKANTDVEKEAVLYITYNSLGNRALTQSDLVRQLERPIPESSGFKLDTPTVDALMAYIAENKLAKIPAQVIHVPEMRKITLAEKPLPGGEGVITKMKDLLNPHSKDQTEAELKKRVLYNIKTYIGRLFGVVEDYRDIEFEIIGEPPSLKLITPQFKGNIEDLGSGIREIVILALDTAGLCNAIMLIEEPENHLHPALIRTWLSAVEEDIEKNNNQYIIATHSPVLLDQSINKTVYKITNKEGFSEVERADESNKLHDAIIEIGARPSDILLPNCVIWVEGITDIYFLRTWLHLFDPKLIVGRHFAFVTYGGACIADVEVGERSGEATDDEKKPFSDLYDILKINRNCVVVMDSDLTEEEHAAEEIFGRRLRESKTRVLKACERSANKTPVLCWVTAGREIENYISDTTINQIFGIKQLGNFDKLGDVPEKKHPYAPKKPRAKEMCEAMSLTSEFETPKLDLKERIQELVKEIKEFNGI